jgi:hypothetical protein
MPSIEVKSGFIFMKTLILVALLAGVTYGQDTNPNPNGIEMWKAALTKKYCPVTGTEVKLQEVMHYEYEKDTAAVDQMVKDKELAWLPAGIKVFVEGPIGQFGEVQIRFPGEHRLYWTLAGFLVPAK